MDMKRDDIMRINPGRILAGLSRKAKEYYNNPERLKELLRSANLIIRDNEQLSDIIDDIGKLISLVRDYGKKEYTMVSKGTIVTVIAGLIYLVNPVDIIPDFLPGGFIDDAAVIGYILSRLKGEIEKYNEWKKIR
jgi:uncharacterized membrane protein YkvA (DUF1232 family)